MRITLVISSMAAGGAQRVLTQMANCWIHQGWEITLLTFDGGSEPPFFPLDPAIKHQPLGISGASASQVVAFFRIARRVRILRRAIAAGKPDAVISFIDTTNVLTLMAAAGLGIPVIVSERVQPASHELKTIWKILRRLTYRFATGVVMQTKEACSYFSPAIRKKIQVIPNSVYPPPSAPVLPSADRSSFKIISAGRLVRQKGFDLLLRAFSRVAAQGPEWSMVIWGEGPERANLENLVRQLGLQDRVSLPGQTSDLYQEFRQADLFVLSSRYEGFPMALCEAMACGLPVVSFQCPSGPGGIIRDGVDGILVPPQSTDLLAQAMIRLMKDKEERRRLANKAPEVVQRFSPEEIMGQWENLIKAVLWKQ